MSIRLPSDSNSDDDWENEDPNLLNNPDLLYAACSKLPPLEHNQDKVKEYWDTAKIVRELILDQNFILDAISKRDEFRGSLDSALNVLETLLCQFQSDCMASHNALVDTWGKSTWSHDGKAQIFSSRSAQTVARWKKTLDTFLEHYLKIRDYLPKDFLEGPVDDQKIDKEKDLCRSIPLIVEELEGFLESFQTFVKCE